MAKFTPAVLALLIFDGPWWAYPLLGVSMVIAEVASDPEEKP